MSTTADTDQRRQLAEMLDHWAGDAYRAGHHSHALRLLGEARAADPSMAPHLDEHRARVSAARQAAEPAGRPLAEVMAARMTDTGITPGDPALARIAEHNTQAQARAGVQPAAAPGPGAPEQLEFRQQVLDAAGQLEAGS
jgi:hypothetical protein